MIFVKFGAWAIAVLLLVTFSIGISIKLTAPRNDASVLPSDQVLEENFRRRESEFNELIKMWKIDSRVIRIADDFTWLDNNANWPRPDSEIGFSQERWNEYRKAFRALSLKRGLMKPMDSDTVFLIASGTGSVASGSSKGYAYSSKPLSPLSGSLENMSPELLSHHTVYKKLSDDWYLFFQGD